LELISRYPWLQPGRPKRHWWRGPVLLFRNGLTMVFGSLLGSSRYRDPRAISDSPAAEQALAGMMGPPPETAAPQARLSVVVPAERVLRDPRRHLSQKNRSIYQAGEHVVENTQRQSGKNATTLTRRLPSRRARPKSPSPTNERLIHRAGEHVVASHATPVP